MKKRNSIFLVCVALLLIVVSLTACTNETEELQARIDALEAENAELTSTISTLRTDLESARTSLSNTQNELSNALVALATVDENDPASQQDDQGGALAITYKGEANKDMSWPLSHGDLPLGLRVNLNDFEAGVEIIWQTTNDDVYTVVQSDDGLTAIVSPFTTGSAELVVTIGDQETRSWVRIT